MGFKNSSELKTAMSDDDSFAILIDRLRAGEDDAVQEVFQRYVGRLLTLTRDQIDDRLAHKVDVEDVVQSAYKSFVLRHKEGKLHVGNRKSLWNLLTLITLRKCARRVGYLRAERRDVRREANAAGTESNPDWHQALDREPMPHEAAVLEETVQELFRSLDELERPILELSLQGYSVTEISERLGRAERSVRRLRERIRRRLERMQASQ
jgi:RNA polymerase sigma-70 factor (ECF subfamily)